VHGNGHAYGQAKHVQAAVPPPADPAPVPADETSGGDEPTVAPPVPVAETPQSVPQGHAYGHDKSGGAPAAPVATTPGE
jgi:hypothetical protein